MGTHSRKTQRHDAVAVVHRAGGGASSQTSEIARAVRERMFRCDAGPQSRSRMLPNMND